MKTLPANKIQAMVAKGAIQPTPDTVKLQRHGQLMASVQKAVESLDSAGTKINQGLVKIAEKKDPEPLKKKWLFRINRGSNGLIMSVEAEQT